MIIYLHVEFIEMVVDVKSITALYVKSYDEKRTK